MNGLKLVVPARGPRSWDICQERDISALEKEWRALEQRVPNKTVFQTFDWCNAWVRAAEAANVAEDVRILTIRSGPHIVLLWPFAVRHLAKAKILHTLGEPASQYSDVLICPSHSAAELMERAWSVIQSWKDIDAIELRRVRDGSAVTNLPGLQTHRVPAVNAEAPYVDFSKLSGRDPEALRSGKSMNALRRHERLLSEHGPVSFSLVGDASDQRAAYAEAVRLKRVWMDDKALASAGYAHPATAGCFERLAADGLLCGARLRVGLDTAAIELGIKRDGAYWSLIQSYDLRFAKHAPGRLLFRDFLSSCPDLGIQYFDFLAPAQKHKIEWSTDAISVGDYVIPNSGRGRAVAAYLGRLRPALKNLHHRLPGWARRRAARLMWHFSSGRTS